MLFHLITLGCDKNTVDSERYVAELAAYGAQPAGSAEEADLIVINTCGFLHAAQGRSPEQRGLCARPPDRSARAGASRRPVVHGRLASRALPEDQRGVRSRVRLL